MKKDTNASTGYLDILRFIGIIAVIVVHTVSGVSDNFAREMGMRQGQIYSAVKAVGTIGVPLFLMVSGALMLDPEKDISIKKLFGKYLKRMVLALILFGMVFALGEMLVKHESGNLLTLFVTAFKRVLAGKSWAHLWYMYVIIGLYLALPILRAFVAKADDALMDYAVLLLLIMTSILPAVLSITGIHMKINFPFKGVYVTYYILGYYLRKKSPFTEEMKGSLVKLAVLLPLLCVVLITGSEKIDISYSSPIIVIWAIVIYELIRMSCSKAEDKAKSANSGISVFCGFMREYIFGIYLIHTVFLNLCYKMLGFTPLMAGGYILIPVFIILDFCVSFVGAWLMRKIPGLRRIV